jgi:hypothetical protein
VATHGDGTPTPEAVPVIGTTIAVTDEAVPEDGTPAPEMMPEMGMATAAGTTVSTTVSEGATGGPAASTGPAASKPSSSPRVVANNNAIEDVSLFDMRGMAHFVLNQVHNVLHREKEDMGKERLCLSVWLSLLKEWTTSKKVKAKVRGKFTDVMEILLDRM